MYFPVGFRRCNVKALEGTLKKETIALLQLHLLPSGRPGALHRAPVSAQ